MHSASKYNPPIAKILKHFKPVSAQRIGAIMPQTVHPSRGFDRGLMVRKITLDMSDIIYPRSPRETMCGWMHLPRFIDKIRLHLAGKLHADYQPNFCKGFDGLWLETASVKAETFIDVVRNSITDGEVCDWVLKNVKQPESVKAAHRQRMLNYPKKDDAEMQARLKMRKENAGLAHRDDIRSFVDFIDADEKRL